MPNGKFRQVVAIIFIVLLLSACEIDSGWTHNSIKGDIQYFEEPLSERAQTYSQALETSNAFIESFSSGQLDEAKELFNARLQTDVSQEDLQRLHEQFLEHFGPMLEYKPMQWAFAKRTEKPDVVASVKIVMHQNSETFYVLTFEDDGKYERILGFRVIAKNEDERVAQAASHVLKGE